MKSICRRLVLAAATAAMLTATAQAATVSLFVNPVYNNTVNTSTRIAEANAVQQALGLFGHTVTTFSGIAAADWTNAGAAADMIVINEIDHQLSGNLVADMTPTAKNALRDYVLGGGALLVFRDFRNPAIPALGKAEKPFQSVNLLNQLFGWSLRREETWHDTAYTLNAAAAANTAFQGGPASLPTRGAGSVYSNSLPTGALNIYSDVHNSRQIDLSDVFLAQAGLGCVGYIGWDWFQFTFNNYMTTTDPWNIVLDNMVDELAVCPVPAPAAAWLLAPGLLGLLGLRRRP